MRQETLNFLCSLFLLLFMTIATYKTARQIEGITEALHVMNENISLVNDNLGVVVNNQESIDYNTKNRHEREIKFQEAVYNQCFTGERI